MCVSYMQYIFSFLSSRRCWSRSGCPAPLKIKVTHVAREVGELRHPKVISHHLSSQHFYRDSWTNPLPCWGSLGKTAQVSWTALEPKAANDAVGTLQPCEWDMWRDITYSRHA